MHDLLSFPSVPATKLAYSKAEATAILGVSLRTIDNLIAHKEITVRRVGRRVLIPLTSMTAFLLRDHCTSMKAAA
jgi:excisionase family DNA binding protein